MFAGQFEKMFDNIAAQTPQKLGCFRIVSQKHQVPQHFMANVQSGFSLELTHTSLIHRCEIRVYLLVRYLMITKRFTQVEISLCYLQTNVWTTSILLSRTPSRRESPEGGRSALITVNGRSEARRRSAALAALKEVATWWSGWKTRHTRDTSHSVKSSSIRKVRAGLVANLVRSKAIW